MDVRRFELDLAAGLVRAWIADAAGEREVTLEGASAAAALAAAEGQAAPREPRLVAAVARAVIEAVRGPRQPLGDEPLDRRFWERIWAEGRDGWELGRAAPPLARALSARSRELAGRRALVVGCGRGHEARLLARLGASVVAVDIAEQAVREARALAAAERVPVEVRHADLFALPEAGERWSLLVEHCCFCAIAPARRRDYVETAAALLEPGGELVGLFWSHGRDGGPPFSVERDELCALLSARFEITSIERPADSVAARAGQEWLVTGRRSADPPSSPGTAPPGAPPRR